MKNVLIPIYFLALLYTIPAMADSWSNEYGGSLRANDHEYHYPSSADFCNRLSYNRTDETFLRLSTSFQAQTGVNLDNLNQGHWGEEVFLNFASPYGEFYVGQMPNVAVQLGINRPNFPTFQPTTADMTNYIDNPNWQQHHRTKFYDTLNSTLLNTDGSSLKLSYLTPEIWNTTIGFSYVPENNANDGLTSKFAPYAKREAEILSVRHYQELSFVDIEAYAAVARYQASHREYAGGLSLYRKGWTVFGSYRQTETSHTDTPPLASDLSSNQLALYDGFRQSKAYNGGLGYEWAFFNTVIEYFESDSSRTRARNRIVNWHNSFRPVKNFCFYLGAAWVDFRPADDHIGTQKRGLAAYTGVELRF
jgi:hypothetical protein